MEFRPLEIKVLSARDLKDVNLFSKMDVYVVASMKGDPYSKQKQKTPVDKDSGPNPNWNFPMKFTVEEASAQNNRLILNFEIVSDRSLGDKPIGEVHVPIKELLDQKTEGSDGNVSYGVRTPSGKTKGTLNFSYKFGEKYAAASQPVPEKAKIPAGGEPMVAYPAGYHGGASGSAAAYPPPGGYPPQPYAEAGKGQGSAPYPYAYPPPGGYQPPPQYGYGGYPAGPGYGYPPPPQYGYGGYPPAGVQPQKPKKNGNMALGIGAGLLGGLLIGDMMSDVGEMAAYDAGFDDGLDF